jgi:hypothetical protein
MLIMRLNRIIRQRATYGARIIEIDAIATDMIPPQLCSRPTADCRLLTALLNTAY